ncbi:MAG: YicC/YloC family endoribonuclease, partial [Acetobacteraceae bacterium]
MIRSMTGFARATRAGEWGELTLELRSVNHRFLDLKLVLPEALRPLEESLRERLRTRLARGRVEAMVRWQARAEDGFSVNRALAREIANAARALAAEANLETPPLPDVRALLNWPGVIEMAGPRLDAIAPEFEALCEEALTGLIGAREREGAALAEALSGRLRSLI